MSRVRLYESAQGDVLYVYGAPVRFTRDPETLERHLDARYMAQVEEAARRAAAQARAA